MAEQVTAEQLRLSFGDDMALLRVRSLLLRVLAAAAELPGAGAGAAADAKEAVLNGGDAAPAGAERAARRSLLGALAEELRRAWRRGGARGPAPRPCAHRRRRASTCCWRPARRSPWWSLAAVLATAVRPGADRAETERRAAAGGGRRGGGDGRARRRTRGRRRRRAERGRPRGRWRSGANALAHVGAVAEMLALAALLLGAARDTLRPPAAPPPPPPALAASAARNSRPPGSASRGGGGASSDGATDGGAGAEGEPGAGEWAVDCVCGLRGRCTRRPDARLSVDQWETAAAMDAWRRAGGDAPGGAGAGAGGGRRCGRGAAPAAAAGHRRAARGLRCGRRSTWRSCAACSGRRGPEPSLTCGCRRGEEGASLEGEVGERRVWRSCNRRPKIREAVTPLGLSGSEAAKTLRTLWWWTLTNLASLASAGEPTLEAVVGGVSLKLFNGGAICARVLIQFLPWEACTRVQGVYGVSKGPDNLTCCGNGSHDGLNFGVGPCDGNCHGPRSE
ncbi:Protein of unknown function [Gryllus bimaculatus]|nr:Protein of unknown function [Gryllus bimaculatus]